MIFEKSIHINASEKAVFNAYRNVSEWPQWDPETEEASIDGEFIVGTTGKIKPKGAPQSKIVLTEVTEDRSFTVECRLPLCKMHFVHLMSPKNSGTHLVNKVEFSGFLAPVFGRLIGKGIDKSLPDSLASLRKHVER